MMILMLIMVMSDPHTGEACHDAVVCAEAAQDADQIPGSTMAQDQHEDHECYLSEGNIYIFTIPVQYVGPLLILNTKAKHQELHNL